MIHIAAALRAGGAKWHSSAGRLTCSQSMLRTRELFSRGSELERPAPPNPDRDRAEPGIEHNQCASLQCSRISARGSEGQNENQSRRAEGKARPLR